MKISQVILYYVGTCIAANSVDLVQHLPKRFDISDTAELSKRMNSPEIHQSIDMKYNGTALNNTEATLTLNATAKGWINISGGCTKGIACDVLGDVNASDNFTSLAKPEDLDDVWIGVAFDSLFLHVDFALNLHPTQPTHEIVQEIGKIPFKLDIAGLAKASLTFTLQFHGWMNNTKAANFTYGFDVQVPDNSAIIFPLQNLLNTEALGFANSTVIPGNFTSTIPDPAFNFQYAFRPQISFHAEAEILNFDYDASIFADIPRVNLDVSQVQNVNAKCEPVPAGVSSAEIFKNLTHITPSVGFDLVLDNNHNVSVLVNSTMPLPTGCKQFYPKETPKSATPSKSEEKKSGGSGLAADLLVRLFGVGVFVIVLL